MPDMQPDLFIPLVGDLPTHDQRDLMERPFFALGKRKRTKSIRYKKDDIEILVTASEEYGMATIYDADILIWVASQLVEAKERGLTPPKIFRSNSAYEILKFIKRGTGGRDYKELKAALERLQNTSVKTTIRKERGKREHHFSWISEWKAHEDEKGRCIGIEFRLSDWLYDGIMNNKLVLTINPQYFELTGGIERWLYRVVRKHGGTQDAGFALTFKTLYEKSGSSAPLKNFSIDIRNIVKGQSIPDYWLEVQRNKYGEEVLYFIHRSKLDFKHEGFAMKHPYHSKFTPSDQPVLFE